MEWPYRERRRLLESFDLRAPAWLNHGCVDDGPTLFAAVVEQGLEGAVAKWLDGVYRPGERDWLKVKNRAYWRFGQEGEVASSRRGTGVAII